MGLGVKRIGTSGTIAGMLLAGSAQATILTTTVSGSGKGYATMASFDPTAGRLLSVYAEASYTSWLPYFSYGTPAGYDHAVSGKAMVGSLSFAIDGASQVSPWDSVSGLFTISATGSATWTDPTYLASFSGASSSILGYAAASATAPGTPMAGNYVPSVSYKLTYTFDNSPAVPEPATWAMMVGGFVLVGAALRAARRGRAVAKPSEA